MIPVGNIHFKGHVRANSVYQEKPMEQKLTTDIFLVYLDNIVTWGNELLVAAHKRTDGMHHLPCGFLGGAYPSGQEH
jgi:hypothetical protein